MKKQKIGLYFGSFNPIHIGHLIIANTMIENGGLDKVWFVVSPQSPFKKNNNLLHEFDRLDMVKAAIGDNYNLEVTDIEFNMPKPSYTIDTLAYLSSKHAHDFKLIIGEDNLKNFDKWKNANVIMEEYGMYVYPRPNAEPSELLNHKNVKLIKAPLLDISASYIRENIKNGRSIKYLVPEEVEVLIDSRKFYI